MKEKSETNLPSAWAGAIVIAISLYLIVTSTFYPLAALTVFDAKRIIQLFLITACLVFAVGWAPLRSQTYWQLSRMSTLSRILLSLFFTIGILSSLRLDHPAYALLDVAMLFLLVCMIATTAASRDLIAEKFDRWAVAALAILGLAVFIQELMGFIAGWVMGSEFSYNTALIHFAHPRFYNQLQTWSIPIIAALPLVFPKKAWLKPACVMLLGLQWFLVIALAARGTTVSLVLAGIFVALWLPKSRKYWLKTNLLGVVAGVAIYLCFLFLNSVFIPQSQSGAFYSTSAGRSMMHTSGRNNLWNLSINDAVNDPWLGSGPSQYACEHDSWLPAHPHSFPMQILGEWGVLAAVFLLVLALIVGVKFLKMLKVTDIDQPRQSALRVVLAMSLLAGLLHACLSGLIIMPASQMALILVGGWALSLSADSRSQSRPSASMNTTLIVPAVIAFIVLFFSLHELKILSERTSNLETYARTTPRFWQSGRVCNFNYDNAERHDK